MKDMDGSGIGTDEGKIKENEKGTEKCSCDHGGCVFCL